jgi:hypothetical protein
VLQSRTSAPSGTFRLCSAWTESCGLDTCALRLMPYRLRWPIPLDAGDQVMRDCLRRQERHRWRRGGECASLGGCLVSLSTAEVGHVTTESGLSHTSIRLHVSSIAQTSTAAQPSSTIKIQRRFQIGAAPGMRPHWRPTVTDGT